MIKSFPNTSYVHLGAVTKYGLACGLAIAALVLRLVLLPETGGFSFVTFFLASVVSFYALGTGPGALTATLGGLAGYLIFWPYRAGTATLATDVLALSFYALATALTGWLAACLHRVTNQSSDVARFYERILEDQTEWINRVRADGTFIYVNKAFQQQFAGDGPSLVGQTWFGIPLEEDVPHINEQIQQMSPARPEAPLEFRVRNFAGQVLWARFNSRGTFNGAGELIEIQSVGRDITHARELEDRLMKLAHDMSDLYDNAPCGYHTLDAEGIYVHINQREIDWLGVTRREVIGKLRITDFMTPEGKAAYAAYRPVLLAVGHVEGLEFDLVARDGSVRRVSVTANVVRDANGRFVMSRSILSDISERHQAEQEVRRINAELEQRVATRTQELEASNRELEAFSYSVSHDLRAPLRAIHGYASIVMEDYGAVLPPEGLKYLQHVQASGQRMGELIDDLLAFARLGHVVPARVPIDHAELVLQALADLRSQCEGREIEFRIGPLPAGVGDPRLLQLVWVNYLSNAIKYTRDAAAAVIEVGSIGDAHEPTWFVHDNGVGFEMRHAHKLFKVFERLHGQEEFEGTGVGLATVHRIVNRHGGRVWAESQPGKGATFYFSLPTATDTARSRVSHE